jgi:hypothetical protein
MSVIVDDPLTSVPRCETQRSGIFPENPEELVTLPLTVRFFVSFPLFRIIIEIAQFMYCSSVSQSFFLLVLFLFHEHRTSSNSLQ